MHFALQFKKYSDTSLLKIWPRLYGKPIVWIAILFNTLVTLLSLYLTTVLDNQSNSNNFAIFLLVITTLVNFTNFLNDEFIDWITIIEENTVRRILGNSSSTNSSVVNNDLDISVSIVGTYIYVPALIISALIYIVYLFSLAPLSLGVLFGVIIASYLPLTKYASWRKKLILAMRNSRNMLVDEYETSDSVNYEKTIDRYSGDTLGFFWGCAFASTVLKIIVFGVLSCTLYIAFDTENALGATIVMGLLLNTAHRIYLSVCDYQEDYYSLINVRDAMKCG